MTNLADDFSAYVAAFVDRAQMPAPFRATDPATGAEHLTPYAALRRFTPLAQLKQRGTFFTGSALAAAVWRRALPTLDDRSVVVDPTSGAGDLLLPAATFAAANGLDNLVIRGCDLDDDFVALTRARLQILRATSPRSVEAFASDFLQDQTSVADATHVVLNPPFVAIPVNEPWAHGTANAAAVFVERALLAMQPGAHLVALLPDVLRSGTRYEQWRRHIATLGRIVSVDPLGQFDINTDVHVFVLDVKVGESGPAPLWLRTISSEETIGDYFDIRVGPVVPHRSPEVGDHVPFVTARSLSSGELLTRQFAGRLESGPMVLINRTSRPGEVPRARARLRLERTAVAVDNHLLVALPRRGGQQACRELARVLASPSTADFLNDRIRCRHLTTTAVKEIPWLI